MWSCLKTWLAGGLADGDGGVPIDAGAHIDALVLRKDGGVELLILADCHLDGSQRTQDLLEGKIKEYLRQRNSVAFNAEFNYPPSDKVHIVLESRHAPSSEIHALVRRLEPVLRASNVRIMFRTHKQGWHFLRKQHYPQLSRHENRSTARPPAHDHA